MDLNTYIQLAKKLSHNKKNTYKKVIAENHKQDATYIKEYLDSIQNVNTLSINKYIEIPYKPKYEIMENIRDISFLENGIEETITSIEVDNPNILVEAASIYNKLKNHKFTHWFTDRDGTINNYCSRYDFSFQSLYNAYIVSSFIKNIENNVILTSAPYNKGLKNISILEDAELIIAGSKGREFSFKNKSYTMDIPTESANCLQQITKEIKKLIKEAPFDIFHHIGSGFQEKIGQITIAKQDINNTIPQSLSQEFQGIVEYIAKKNDSTNKLITIEDTGKDIEIILNDKNKEFSKGEGIDFIAKQLSLNLSSGNILVTGDTPSDVPMVEKCLKYNPNVVSIFVTTDENLKKYLSTISENSYYVSSPDALLYLLHLLS